MTTITFIEHDGTEHIVEPTDGESLMLAAINNLVPGIDADCGGECSCATCHVMLTPEWFDRLGGPHDREEEMLDMNPERHERSRLACQIPVTQELDGMIVQLPEFQF
ncbi:MAG: 2Fe-2S iron-sulfur cluster-binding protein [Gammaproteobacteria bacterium]|nr:2Fe-2S iron-sulfur cluster-binding protein [Gammaproteobacteria bacterium]